MVVYGRMWSKEVGGKDVRIREYDFCPKFPLNELSLGTKKKK